MMKWISTLLIVCTTCLVHAPDDVEIVVDTTRTALRCDLPLEVCGIYYRVYDITANAPLCYACDDGMCVPHEAWCVPGDLDWDGDVDLHDYGLFLNEWTGPL